MAGLALDKPSVDHPHCVPFTPRGPLARIGGSSAMASWLEERANNGLVDVLHCHSVWFMPVLYSARTALRFDLPLVVSSHGTLSNWAFRHGSPLKRLSWHLTQRRALQRATLFRATCDAERDEVRAMGFRQPIVVIPHGIDLEPSVIKSTNDRRTLLFLSRIHPGKGIDDLLTVWSQVQERFPDWDLQIAGPLDTPFARATAQRAAEARIPRVRFVGEVSGAIKHATLSNADLFVLPTYSENWGIAVGEALACATPVIVSRGAPWSEVESRGAGWWPEPGTAGLRRAMEAALSSPREELRLMGARGRDWVSQNFSWTRVAEQLRDAYESIC